MVQLHPKTDVHISEDSSQEQPTSNNHRDRGAAKVTTKSMETHHTEHQQKIDELEQIDQAHAYDGTVPDRYYEHTEKQDHHIETATSRMERNHGTDTCILLVAEGSPEQEMRPNPADSDGGKDGANLSVEEKTYRPKDWAQEGIALMCE